MPMIESNGAKFNVEVTGDESKPALMLSNSLGTNFHMWDDQMPEWSKHFRIIRYDRRGHGGSDVTPGAYTMEQLGKDVLGILDALKVQKTNWCGVSMGGMVGQWLGANAPERFIKMVYSFNTYHYADKSSWNDRINIVQEKGLAPMASGNMERWFSASFREKNPDKLKRMTEMFLSTKPEGWIGCGSAVRDMDHRELLPKIKVPVLIIAGKEDKACPVEAAETMQKQIPGAKLQVMNTAHIGNVELPEEYTKVVLDFLRS